MEAVWQIEADLKRVQRQMREVKNPDTATALRARAVLLEHRLETLRAIGRH